MEDTARNPDPGPPPARATRGMPGWVKVFGVIVAVAILLYVGSLLLGVGHGAGRHGPAGDPVPSGAPDGHTPPAGAH